MRIYNVTKNRLQTILFIKNGKINGIPLHNWDLVREQCGNLEWQGLNGVKLNFNLC